MRRTVSGGKTTIVHKKIFVLLVKSYFFSKKMSRIKKELNSLVIIPNLKSITLKTHRIGFYLSAQTDRIFVQNKFVYSRIAKKMYKSIR
jgi:hypothetical protein